MRFTFPNRLLLANGVLFLIGAPLLSTKPAVAHANDRCPDQRVASSAFALEYQGVETRSPVSAAFVLPGETVDVAVERSTAAESVAVHASAGLVSQAGATEWRWRAPAAPGSYTLQVMGSCKADSAIVHAFVMVPASEVRAGYLNGFRIGNYPRPPARRQATYQPPLGFIEVTPQNQDVFITPHLQLKQFLTKQPGGYPKYVVLDPRLLQKLELIFKEVHDAGYAQSGFFVMSGYRTPAYNRDLGNVQFSRHQYGAAADIFIDERPRDGVMDDLNHDGRTDIRDARVLYDLIDRHQDDPAFRPLIGGLGLYPSTSAHGPFVHVDVRGYAARW
ncbi:MAG TPA: D-Ala-D-Ala carboxypeptidase family metallohydrolase [Gemmatimonadales bacterium]|nr:D-Ala-D-Ala carboxypeptidase family metallohydrolase [Gemmatimonadales bacterium]